MCLRVFIVVACLVCFVGCDSGKDKLNPKPLPPAASSSKREPPVVTPSPVPSPSSSPSVAPPPKPDAKAPFVYVPSGHSDEPVDACTQVGGNYFSCAGEYDSQKDVVVKRYLLRIARGHAAGVKGYQGKGEPLSDDDGMPHAEVPGMCAIDKPCDHKEGELEYNQPMSCLARAYEERLKHRARQAEVAHALACRCNGNKPHFIAYNSTAEICDENGKPAWLAPDLASEEGADIVACAACDATRGAAACEREITRLEEADPEVARYIADKRVPRCQTPGDP